MFKSAILDEVSSRMILFLSDQEPEDFAKLKALSLSSNKLQNGKSDEGDTAPLPV